MNKFLKVSMVFLLFVFVGSMAAPAQTYSVADKYFYTKVKASHILVDTKEEALSIKQKLDKGEDFSTLAQKYSKCPSGQDGGDLGYFARGTMVKDFETAAFNLKPGEISQPVRTQFGWHLIKVFDKQ